jgi:hydrophobic/amphiphilic exporter-1 (mainly G- bacteria), HAE1 family
MAANLGNAPLREIGTLFAVGTIGGLSDGQLIERFLSGPRDQAQAAFANLVDRHGALVTGVCRRLLPDPNDADDAFQATFLVLVRKAHSIARKDLLANWLYAMRIFLNPDRMRDHNLSSEDVMNALSVHSMIRPAGFGSPGRLGEATGRTSQSKEYVLTYIGRFDKPEQYNNIVLKATPHGEILWLKDVGEVELGPQALDIYSDLNGHPAASIVLKQAPGSNAAEDIDESNKELERIKKESFPAGMNFEVIPLEQEGMIYAVILTPPGSTLE